jgi:hypothetical protein
MFAELGEASVSTPSIVYSVATPSLRALSIGEILDVSIKITWDRARVLVPLAAIFVAPLQAVATLITISSNGLATTTVDPVTGQQTTHFHAGATTAVVLLTLVAGLLAAGGCFQAVRSTYLGEAVSVRESLVYAVRRLHSLVWVCLLVAIISYIGLIIVILPGVFLWTCFAVAVPVLMAEGVKGWRALVRSFRLIWGRWWGSFTVLLLAFLLRLVVALAIVLAIDALSLTAGGTTGQDIVSGVGQVIAALITLPFAAVLTTVLYFDRRVRKEGFDLELQIEHMAVAGAEAPEQ